MRRANSGTRAGRAIGPVGTAARVLLGSAFVALAFLGGPPRWWQFALGLVGFPLVLVAWMALRARSSPENLRASSPTACLALVVFVAPLFYQPTRPPSLLFLGASMIVAAIRGYANCEITAVGNWVLGRYDQVTCPVFTPLDLLDRAAAPRGRG